MPVDPPSFHTCVNPARIPDHVAGDASRMCMPGTVEARYRSAFGLRRMRRSRRAGSREIQFEMCGGTPTMAVWRLQTHMTRSLKRWLIFAIRCLTEPRFLASARRSSVPWQQARPGIKSLPLSDANKTKPGNNCAMTFVPRSCEMPRQAMPCQKHRRWNSQSPKRRPCARSMRGNGRVGAGGRVPPSDSEGGH